MDEDEKYNRKLEAGLYTLQVKDLLHFNFVLISCTGTLPLQISGILIVVSFSP